MIIIFASCSGANIVKTYTDAEKLPSNMTLLDPRAQDDIYAVLLRKFDESKTSVALCDGVDGEFDIIYELPAGTITYELTAAEGLIAFYELSMYSDGSVNYALKVIDTKNENKVHNPYSKTISEDGDLQTRFLCIYNGAVYYLTKSNLLGRCRVMKYDVNTNDLTEYLSYDFTENVLTDNSSCTSISERAGYLTCAVVSGSRTTLKTYDLNTNELVREKELPYGAALVYMAQSDERVGVFAYSDNEITDLITLNDDQYLNHEQVRIYQNDVSFVVQDTSKTVPRDQFCYMCAPVTGGELIKLQGVFDTVYITSYMWGLEFDNKKGYDAVHLITIMN